MYARHVNNVFCVVYTQTPDTHSRECECALDFQTKERRKLSKASECVFNFFFSLHRKAEMRKEEERERLKIQHKHLCTQLTCISNKRNRKYL